MFSVVIPTMQRSAYLERLLAMYLEHDRVGQVIVVNNSVEAFPHEHAKLQVINPGGNIFVNPAWNRGAAAAEHDRLIISNDDILFDPDVLDDCHELLTRKVGMIGPDKSCYEGPKGRTRLKYILERPWGWGTLMMMRTRNYVPIPDELKIWSGDTWLFDHQKRPNFMMLGPVITTKMGSTSRDPQFHDQKWADAKRFGEMMSTKPYALAMARRDKIRAKPRALARRLGLR